MFIRLVCNLCDGYFVKESPRSSKLAFAKKGDLVDCTCSACGEPVELNSQKGGE